MKFAKYIPKPGGFQRSIKDENGVVYDFEQEVILCLCSDEFTKGDKCFLKKSETIKHQDEHYHIMQNEPMHIVEIFGENVKEGFKNKVLVCIEQFKGSGTSGVLFEKNNVISVFGEIIGSEINDGEELSDERIAELLISKI